MFRVSVHERRSFIFERARSRRAGNRLIDSKVPGRAYQLIPCFRCVRFWAARLVGGKCATEQVDAGGKREQNRVVIVWALSATAAATLDRVRRFSWRRPLPSNRSGSSLVERTRERQSVRLMRSLGGEQKHEQFDYSNKLND
jgi:hypothetical protein